MSELMPWERQPNEPPKAFKGFALYRDFGEERSYAKVATVLEKTVRHIEQWGVANKWQDRVLVFEQHQDKLRLRRLDRKRREMLELHATIAQSVIDKFVVWLNAQDAKTWSEAAALRAFTVATKVHRLALDLPTEKIDQAHSGEVAHHHIEEVDDQLLQDPEFRRLTSELLARTEAVRESQRQPTGFGPIPHQGQVPGSEASHNPE